MSGNQAPRKVAVLGGGVGAMVAAFELAQEPHWERKYEITVYQLGWRLGGKGASGRERARGDRILEHGLHIWCGFYDNSFRCLRPAYEAAKRPPEVPIRSVEQAFCAVSEVYLSDFVDDHPHVWRIDFPANDEVPSPRRRCSCGSRRRSASSAGPTRAACSPATTSRWTPGPT